MLPYCLRLRSLPRRVIQSSFIGPASRIPLNARRFLSYTSGRENASDDLGAKLASESRIEGINFLHFSRSQCTVFNEFPFDVVDHHSQNKVSLNRNCGNERIKVIFSWVDINSQGLDMTKEFSEGVNHADTAEHKEGFDLSTDHTDELLQDFYFPCQVQIEITKDDTNDTLVIMSEAEPGRFNISRIFVRKSSNDTRPVYRGPPFSELDKSIHTGFANYLGQRGIDAGLATAICSYADWKEQREYIYWLKNTSDFLASD